MAAFNKFNQFAEDIAKGIHKLNADALFVMLTNTAPIATNSILSDITEITPANGYVAGGNAATFTTGVQTAGVYKLVLADVLFTASAGAINTFRYAVLYNKTQTTPLKPLIGWWDYAAAQNITAGNSFLVDLDQAAGVLTVT